MLYRGLMGPRGRRSASPICALRYGRGTLLTNTRGLAPWPRSGLPKQLNQRKARKRAGGRDAIHLRSEPVGLIDDVVQWTPLVETLAIFEE